MVRRPRKVNWRVSFPMGSVLVIARNRAAAVYQACRRLGIIKPATDHETGGWKHTSVEPAKVQPKGT